MRVILTPEQKRLAAMKPSQGMVDALTRAGVPVPDNALEAVRVLRGVIDGAVERKNVVRR